MNFEWDFFLGHPIKGIWWMNEWHKSFLADLVAMLVFSLWRMTTACPERLHEGSDGAFRNRTQGGFPSSTGTSDVCNTSKNRKIRLHPFSAVPPRNIYSFILFWLFSAFYNPRPCAGSGVGWDRRSLVWEGHCGYHPYLTKLYVASGNSELG